MVEDSGQTDRHDIALRDVRDGELVVSYNHIVRKNSSYTAGRHVSSRLPVECLEVFDGGTVAVSELTDEERQWLTAESAARSNTIDFEGVDV